MLRRDDNQKKMCPWLDVCFYCRLLEGVFFSSLKFSRSYHSGNLKLKNRQMLAAINEAQKTNVTPWATASRSAF
jgi:hypothetical protein